MATAFFFAVLASLPAAAPAVDVPFTRVFFGRQFRSLLDDAAHYPASYISIEASYWDIYYERRGVHLHDYDQRTGSVTAVIRRGSFLLGAGIWGDDLSLRQENVYTDADGMAGSKENRGGKGIVGYTLARDLPLALTRVELLGAAGGNGQFLGEVEARLSWADAAELLVTAQTFANTLEVEQDIDGSRFPFHFPFATDRWFARVQVNAPSSCTLRAWGFYETNSGEGTVVRGFENRVWVERGGGGASVDYRLQPAHRLDLTPRLSDADARGPGVRVQAAYTGAECDLAMYFDEVRYLHLDRLRIDNPVVRLDVVPLGWLSVFGGWERLRVEHHGDSFFDAWPFTIWDIFQATRYRLDDLEGTLDTWFAGASGRLETGPLLGELAGRFEWWNQATSLDWLERVSVLFPFFFRYERHSETWEAEADYALQLDAALWWRFGAAALRVSGRAAIPFQGAEEGSGGGPAAPPGTGATPPAAPGEESSHGGLIGAVELVVGH
jgi:hypothetical protein